MSFIAALKARARQVKREAFALLLAARHPGTPLSARLFLLAVVTYTASPIDLIPDFIPVLGFLDEIILLPFAITLAAKMVPSEVMSECRARASVERLDGSRLGRIGAVLVASIWLSVIGLVAMWAMGRSDAA